MLGWDRHLGHCARCKGLVAVGWNEPPHHVLAVATVAAIATGWATPLVAMFLLVAWGARILTSAHWGCRTCGNAVTLTRIMRVG